MKLFFSVIIFLIDPNIEQSVKLQVNEFPYTLLADNKGKIVYIRRGYRNGDEKDLVAKIGKRVLPKKLNSICIKNNNIL